MAADDVTVPADPPDLRRYLELALHGGFPEAVRAPDHSQLDILVELDINRVIGIEVKAAGAPRKDAAQHLMWLRHELGERFVGGIVLHTGPRAYMLDDRIVAAPLCALWG